MYSSLNELEPYYMGCILRTAGNYADTLTSLDLFNPGHDLHFYITSFYYDLYTDANKDKVLVMILI